MDGNVQDRRGAISVFNGPEPDIRECEDSGSESEQVAAWIEQRRGEGLTPREFGIFVRSEAGTPARSLWRTCSGEPASTRPASDRARGAWDGAGGDFSQLPPRPMSGTEPLPPWRPLLRGAREREGRSPQARWLQLATLAPDGTPRVRTLVFRGWAGPTALDLLTDGRSAKPAELAHQPAVELCWLLPRARSQFRLRGSLQTLAPEQVQRERERHWQMLSPGGRALWGWPPPGQPFDPEAAFPEQLPDGSPLPDHFQLLRIALAQVELLELTGHPHRRRRWRGESGWAEERLNP